MRQHRLHAAPGVDHIAHPVKVFEMVSGRNLNLRGNRHRIILPPSPSQLPQQGIQTLHPPRGSPRPGVADIHPQPLLQPENLRLRQAVGYAGRVHGVNGRANKKFVVVRANHHQQAVVPHPLQARQPLQQPGNGAALYIQRVGRQLNHIRSIQHIRMRNQRVADRGQQGGHRHCIAGVAANFRPYAGRHQKYGIKVLCILNRPGFQPEKRLGVQPPGLPSQQSDFAMPVGPRPARHRQPNGDFPRRDLLCHRPT